MQILFEKLVYGGDAIGRAPDGRTVFAPYAAPGDLARVELVEEKTTWMRARVVEVLEPSPARITPRCRHFGECGGCHWQHLGYETQLRAKEEILREQLRRLGGFADPAIRAIKAAPAEWSYRNHIQFSLAKDGKLGFHRAASPRVMAAEECWLPESSLADLWKSLDFEPFPGLRQVGLRAADDGEMIVFESDTGEAPEVSVEADVSAAVTSPDGGSAYLAGGPLHYETNGRQFRVSAASFFQVHTAMIPVLVEEVLRQAEPAAEDAALDLYCGTGLFSAFLAPRVARLVGVEFSPSAVADFESNLDDFDNVELFAAGAGEVLPALTGPFALAVADPPRGGLEPDAMRGLLRVAPRRIVMVSCDPATLARDGRKLREGGYALEVVQPVDLFPQTFHLETVSLWCREA